MTGKTKPLLIGGKSEDSLRAQQHNAHTKRKSEKRKNEKTFLFFVLFFLQFFLYRMLKIWDILKNNKDPVYLTAHFIVGKYVDMVSGIAFGTLVSAVPAAAMLFSSVVLMSFDIPRKVSLGKLNEKIIHLK